MAQDRPIVADLDFASIKEDLIEHFKSREEFKDYEFTGSGMNLLLDILAYNTHYNALTANMMLNEMFIDSALLRPNVVSKAKQMNYLPRSARCASVNITLTVTKPTNDTYYVVPAGTAFTATGIGSSQRFNFYTLIPYTLQFGDDDVSLDVTVVAYEGKYTTQRFSQTATNSKSAMFDLGNENIDTTTISVSVNNSKYTQLVPENEGITKTDGTDLIYYVEETRNRTHRIVFGDGRVGATLSNGDVVTVSYLISSGTESNGLNTFSLANSSNVMSIKSNGVSVNGDYPETIREIRRNAPRWFQSQYRAVTEKDYDVFLRSKYSNIQALSVYGGENIGSPGKVFICIKPKTGDTLSDATKSTIISDIIAENNVVTVTPVIVDPSYLNIVLKTVVIYDGNVISTSPDLLEAAIITMYERFNTEYIGDFMKTFRASQLAAEIQDIDDSVISSNTRVTLRVDVEAKNQTLDTYSFTFGNKLYHPEDGFKKATGGILSTNNFYRVGRSYTSGFDDDGYGKIRLFDLINDSKVYVNEQAGSIDYNTGKCEILINVDPKDSTIEFSAIPDSFDVISENDVILRIATNKCSVKAVEQSNYTTQKTINLSRSV